MKFSVDDVVTLKGQVISVLEDEVEFSFAPGYLLKPLLVEKHQKAFKHYEVGQKVRLYGIKAEIVLVTPKYLVVLYEGGFHGFVEAQGFADRELIDDPEDEYGEDQ